jgi:hypothetical protein
VIGETRPNCVDLPPEERDQIICLYPEEQCEMTTAPSEFGTYDASLSPEIAIYALLICTPLQFLFEFMCVMLARMKVVNHENTLEPLRLLLSQILVTAIFTVIIA